MQIGQIGDKSGPSGRKVKSGYFESTEIWLFKVHGPWLLNWAVRRFYTVFKMPTYYPQKFHVNFPTTRPMYLSTDRFFRQDVSGQF